MALAVATAMGSAHAQLPNEYATVSGAVCKPAGQPATNPGTYFAAKAIGARNEGTTNVFAICPFTQTPTPVEGGVITELNLSSYSIDGNTHSMQCTAVIGSLNRPLQPAYSTKTVTVTSDPNGVVTKWTAADFGGTAGDGIPGSAWASFTCLVPGQTGIALIYAKLNDRIE